MSSSLWPCGLQYTRFPCPSLSPGVCSNSHPLSWWCHPVISSCNPLLLPPVFPSIFPKTYWWPTDTWKDAQHHSSLEKCKSKPQWDITSYLLEWLSQKKKTNVRMWRIFEPLYCCWECKLVQPVWKTVLFPKKNLKQSYHMTMQFHFCVFI